MNVDAQKAGVDEGPIALSSQRSRAARLGAMLDEMEFVFGEQPKPYQLDTQIAILADAVRELISIELGCLNPVEARAMSTADPSAPTIRTQTTPRTYNEG